MKDTILFITDRPDFFIQTQKMLQHNGHEVKFFDFNLEVLSTLYESIESGESEINIIILDYQVPEIRGGIDDFLNPEFIAVPLVVIVEQIDTNGFISLLDIGVKNVRHIEKTVGHEFSDYLEQLMEKGDAERNARKIQATLERNLIQEYNKTQGLLNSLSLGITIFSGKSDDGNYRILDINKGMAALLKFDANELLHKTQKEAIVYLKDKPAFEMYMKNLEEVQEGNVRTLTLHLDTVTYIKRVITPFRDRLKKIQGFIWMFLDVTHEVERGLIDPLTGLMNRRYLDDRLSRELVRSLRYDAEASRSISVLMCDIDDFKTINDTYGHPEGDRIIQAVARAIQETIRQVDIASRYGGEEYTIILPSTSLAEAKILAERIRKTIFEQEWIVGRPVSISIGAASSEHLLPATTEDNNYSAEEMRKGIKSLIELADRSLYVAKNSGKNRVVVSENPG